MQLTGQGFEHHNPGGSQPLPAAPDYMSFLSVSWDGLIHYPLAKQYFVRTG